MENELTLMLSFTRILLLLSIAYMAFLIFFLCFQIAALRHRSAAPGPLDPSILKAIPVVAYSARTDQAVRECAVCLSEFQDGDEARMLPACKHTFHSVCVDLWFRSHSNCPLCLPALSPVQCEKIKPDLVGITVDFEWGFGFGPLDRLAHLCR